MLAEDIEAGGGGLKIRQTDPGNFKIGVNIATTPGKVIFRNDLIELIQYAPTTEKVLKRPLLIVPPWINKFYILDLNAEKSFIRWAVSQGLTVFCISWVNPSEEHAHKGFEHYMREGIFAALDAIEQATGEKKVTTIGYCVGGTLLAVAMAYMAAKRDKRIDSATFFTAQVDFTHAGDLKVFADEEQISAVEAAMRKRGYLEGSQMANAFNMLRPNDLIWSNVVNVYMKGQAPFPFDLLYWNSDSTRMPAANHAFYLRNCYLENKLTKGEMEVGGVKLDLKKVKAPVFNLATKEDHIAPARSVFLGSKSFGGPVDFVLAGSGHIAGVVNSPNKPKYQFWTGGPVEGQMEDWMKQASETAGSWWPYWFDWVKAQAPRMVAAREPGGGKLEPLGDAPGTYVLGEVVKPFAQETQRKGRRNAGLSRIVSREELSTCERSALPGSQPPDHPSGSAGRPTRYPRRRPHRPRRAGLRNLVTRKDADVRLLREDVGYRRCRTTACCSTDSWRRPTPRCGRCQAGGWNGSPCRSATARRPRRRAGSVDRSACSRSRGSRRSHRHS
jgi:polyhydroxyalkanoate synthase